MLKIEIHIMGEISEKWSGWFGGLTISHPDTEETVLSGLVVDQAALYGIISRVGDLGLQLTSVSSEETVCQRHASQSSGSDARSRSKGSPSSQ
jgi:hypothetical protein